MKDNSKTINLFSLCLELASRLKNKNSVTFAKTGTKITIRIFDVPENKESEASLLKYYSVDSDNDQEVDFCRAELQKLLSKAIEGGKDKWGYVGNYTHEDDSEFSDL